METIEKDGISITLYLNADRSVDLKKKMMVKYVHQGAMQIKEIYPDAGTIDHQFEYVKTSIKFDQAYEHRKNIIDPPKN